MDYSWMKFYFSIFNTGIYLIILSTLRILCSNIKLVWKLHRDGNFSLIQVSHGCKNRLVSGNPLLSRNEQYENLEIIIRL